ncbi:MAG: hypothetical protein NC191_08035 [Muribaculaceae bacterium]|nr:hypothetical protein [Muribaculaceae bacterium]
MKIHSITATNIYQGLNRSNVWQNRESGHAQYEYGGTTLGCMPVYYPISFGIQNSSKLRILFGYDLPCIYSGVTMIDPKQLTRMQKNKLFYKPAKDVLRELDKYPNSFRGMEAQFIDLLRERSNVHPEMTIKDILDEVKPIYARRLRKKQAPVFQELIELSKELPESYRKGCDILMSDTKKRLYDKPVVVPFSSYEFKYKLCKIRDDIANGSDKKSKKVMAKLIKESKRLSNTTNDSTIENQKKVVAFMEIILRKSVLKNNPQLKNLIEVSKARLNREEIYTPFSRKSFIYDLAKLIENLPDDDLYERIILTAQKLPTSQENFSAYVMKLAHEQPDKIGHRLLWPSLASVEHLLPRSDGGEDIMANFAGATTRENSTRKSIKFIQQLKLRPDTPKYCQMYVDRLIDLYHQGVFAQHNINPNYINDFANTIYALSQHRVKLDLSKM